MHVPEFTNYPESPGITWNYLELPGTTQNYEFLKSWNLTNKFLILMSRRRYATAFQNPTCVYFD